MKKDFVEEMNLENIPKYQKPHMILLSGLPGSGKTYVARQLSIKHKLFLLSTDYVRNYYYSHPEEIKGIKIPLRVSAISSERLTQLLFNHVSFIFDKDVNTHKELKTYQRLSKAFGYELLLIGIESEDKDNIERISKRVMDFDKVINGVVGDNVHYESAYSDDCYYEIKDRKPRELTYTDFDYIIKNNGTKKDLDKKINVISKSLSHKLVKAK